MIKDLNSLPRIDDTLDCLNGAMWFTTTDLKSGYWQVKMDEAFKPLTALTLGPSKFFEYDHMPFGPHFKDEWKHVWVNYSLIGASFISMTS